MDIVVHRGANDAAPENTMAAARACADLGVSCVEIDVRQSRDGVHYILHDRTLDRTTNGSGPIGERRSDYIDGLDAGSWFSSQFAGEHVPRLDTFLDWARGTMQVFFDFKDGDLAAVVRMIRERGMKDDVFFWFADDEQARELRRIAPDIPLKMNSRSAAEVRRHKMEFDNQIVEQGPDDASETVIRACRELGIRTMATVFRGAGVTLPALEERYAAVIDLGYDMVNLDWPRPFIEYLVSRGLR